MRISKKELLFVTKKAWPAAKQKNFIYFKPCWQRDRG